MDMAIFSKKVSSEDVEGARRRARDLEQRIEQIGLTIGTLRERRTKLLAAVGIGEPDSENALRQSDKELSDALREERLLCESRTELKYNREKTEIQRLRVIAEDELGRLPKLESDLDAALDGLRKVVSKIELAGIEELTKGFCHPGISEFQTARVRAALSEALASSVARLVVDPASPPHTDCGSVRALLERILTVCDVADEQALRRMQSGRQSHVLERRRLEAQTLL